MKSTILNIDDRLFNRLPDSKVSVRIPATISSPILRGREGRYLEEIHAAVGGEVSLNRKENSAFVQIFSGPKATRAMEVKALMDTGSPATFIQYPVWKKMVDIGAATIEGAREIDPVSWGGFNGVPLCTSSQVRLNLRLWPRKPNPKSSIQNGRACLAVYAHVVPEGTMNYDILVGRDGLELFPVRTYRDVDKRETVMTLEENDVNSVNRASADSVRNAVGFVEPESVSPQMVMMYNGPTKVAQPDKLSWTPVKLYNMDGLSTKSGTYYVTLDPGWSPNEIIVEAGESIIPLRYTGLEGQILARTTNNNKLCELRFNFEMRFKRKTVLSPHFQRWCPMTFLSAYCPSIA